MRELEKLEINGEYYELVDRKARNNAGTVMADWIEDNKTQIQSVVATAVQPKIDELSDAVEDLIDTLPEDFTEVEEDITQLKQNISSIVIETIIQEASTNLLNPATATNGKYISNSNTEIEQTGYAHSAAIPVKAGKKVRCTYWSNVSSARGVFYNADMEKVDTVTNRSDLTTNTTATIPYWECTAPENAKYIKVNFRWSEHNTKVMVTVDDDFPEEFEAFQAEVKERALASDISVTVPDGFKPKLYGKKIMFCGDSITYGAQAELDDSGNRKNYGYYIQKATGCNAQYNAISGSTMMNVTGKNPFSVSRYQQLGTGLDYIILAFVTNDSAESVDLIGQWGDTTNASFYGAWKVVLDYLISTYPTTKIGIVGFWRGNQKYRYTDALRDISNRYRIPFLDFMLDENVPMVGGTDFRSYYPDAPFTVDYNTMVARQNAFLADTVHPNDAGYQYLAPIIQNFIERL